MYTKAIEKNPNQVKYHSNRCAAYLCLGNAKKALNDADVCCKLKQDWPKSWSRKGASLFLMEKYIDAIVAYQRGLALDPDSVTLKLGLSESRDANSERPDFSALERAESEVGDELETENKKDVMDMFMSEIEGLDGSAASKKSIKVTKRKVDDTEVDALTGEQHIDRLVQKNYKWKNLNPFYVLLLPTDITEEDIKQRYHKMSSLVHPDKSSDPRARKAFLEVKKAYQELKKEERRDVLSRLVKGAERSARKRLSKEEKELSESEIKEECAREVMKVFAQAEQRRLVAKRNSVVYTQRERVQEHEEKLQREMEIEQEKHWKAGREKRMKSWSDFQHGANKNKRQKLYGFDIKMPEVRKEEADSKNSTTTTATSGSCGGVGYKKRWR